MNNKHIHKVVWIVNSYKSALVKKSIWKYNAKSVLVLNNKKTAMCIMNTRTIRITCVKEIKNWVRLVIFTRLYYVIVPVNCYRCDLFLTILDHMGIEAHIPSVSSLQWSRIFLCVLQWMTRNKLIIFAETNQVSSSFLQNLSSTNPLEN